MPPHTLTCAACDPAAQGAVADAEPTAERVRLPQRRGDRRSVRLHELAATQPRSAFASSLG